MIVGFHLIFGAYGFWLPNDPRGSWSTYVGSRPLRRFGPATKTTTHRSLAYRSHDFRQRLAAKSTLQRDPVFFTGLQAREIGRGFGAAIAESAYVAHACSILPDHAHLVCAWHERDAKQIIGHLKGRATQALTAAGNPADSSGFSPWSEGGWVVFLFDQADMRRAIRYVEQNPIKEGKPLQRWSFVTPYAAGKPAG